MICQHFISAAMCGTNDALPANKPAQSKTVDPTEIKSDNSFFLQENATVDHAPDRPPESVHYSSPLASQGLAAPPGLHRFQFQGKRWVWVPWPAKKTKNNCNTRSGTTSCVTERTNQPSRLPKRSQFHHHHQMHQALFPTSTPAPFSKHQSRPGQPGNLAFNLEGTFPSHPSPSKFPSTFSNLHPNPRFQAPIPTRPTRQPRMQPRRPFSQPTPPIKFSKALFPRGGRLRFSKRCVAPNVSELSFWPMQLSGPCLELHLRVYNRQSKKFPGIVKVQKYCMPRGFAICAPPPPAQAPGRSRSKVRMGLGA